MTYSHLTFDCYGTLIDWRRGIEDHLGALLRGKGLSPDQRAYPLYVEMEAREESGYKPYREILRDTAMKVAAHLGTPVSRKEAEAFAASVPLWPPFGDTGEVLRELGRRGYQRVILSNVDRDLLQATVKRNQLEVDGFITAEEVKSYKPALGHWMRFLEAYSVKKREVLHVAQSLYHDIIPASKLGLSTAWINRYGDPPPASPRPTYTSPNLEGLLGILR